MRYKYAEHGPPANESLSEAWARTKREVSSSTSSWKGPNFNSGPGLSEKTVLLIASTGLVGMLGIWLWRRGKKSQDAAADGATASISDAK